MQRCVLCGTGGEETVLCYGFQVCPSHVDHMFSHMSPTHAEEEAGWCNWCRTRIHVKALHAYRERNDYTLFDFQKPK